MPSVAKFQKIIKDYYKAHGRHFPWRTTTDPYKILVSEIMLQQTQAPRVVEKYNSFLARFPSLNSLAKARTTSVLKEWQGLGYNRRGLALKKAAEIIVKNFRGKIPSSTQALLSLPGVGPATAGDLQAFAWNQPSIVIETNIRAVFIYFFFTGQSSVPDSEIMPLIKKTLDTHNPRDWYFALMDYGAFLKKTQPNPSRQSQHYRPQSPFLGSNREIRSKILKYILSYPHQSLETISESLAISKEIIEKNLTTMAKEGLLNYKIQDTKKYYTIAR